MFSYQLALILSILALGMNTLPVFAQRDNQLHINEIQVIGTHNSYHAGFAPSAATLWQARDPQVFNSLDYKHQPLEQQFDSGIRQIELDIFSDSKGGLYAHPSGPAMIEAAHLPPDPDFDPNGIMAKPGFKVMHVQDIDYRSTCQPFIACLEQVRHWSHAHPRHIPIFILVETKDGKPHGPIQLTEPEPFTSSTFDALDAEIRSVFPRDEVIVPDDVRGRYATLNQAVLAGNWPTLDRARGKVIFLMDQQQASPIYLAGHPALRGRILFTNSEPGDPDAAFIERNDGPADEITALVRKGYLVRTRTDAETKEARTNDTARRDAMMTSGAQILSTDNPASEPARWPGHYFVALPGSPVARCNPVNSPIACSAGSLK
jgi:hypothetical protein